MTGESRPLAAPVANSTGNWVEPDCALLVATFPSSRAE